MFKKNLTAGLLAMLLIGGFSGCENAYEKEKKPSSFVSSSVFEQTGFSLQEGIYTARYRDPAFDGAVDTLTISVKKGEVSIEQYQLEADVHTAQKTTSSEAGEETLPNDLPNLPDFGAMADAVLLEYERVHSPQQMQPVAGALEHGWRFSRMMQLLLQAAQSGEDKPQLLDGYIDGIYRCTSAQSDRSGLRHTLTVTVKEGKIQSAQMQADGPYDRAVYDTLTAEFAAQNGDTEKMQVSDAHYGAYKSLLRLAPSLMKGMITGDQTPVQSAGWIDGQYRAQYADFDENGWKSFVDVSISGGVPIVIGFDAYHEEDETRLRSEDVEVEERMQQSNGINFTQAAKYLVQNWHQVSADVAAVDSVAGATVASNDFKVLLSELLSTAAVEGNTAPIELMRYLSEPISTDHQKIS